MKCPASFLLPLPHIIPHFESGQRTDRKTKFFPHLKRQIMNVKDITCYCPATAQGLRT